MRVRYFSRTSVVTSILTQTKETQAQLYFYVYLYLFKLNCALKQKYLQQEFQTSVVLEWLTFLFRILDVWGSNLGPETDFPD